MLVALSACSSFDAADGGRSEADAGAADASVVGDAAATDARANGEAGPCSARPDTDPAHFCDDFDRGGRIDLRWSRRSGGVIIVLQRTSCTGEPGASLRRSIDGVSSECRTLGVDPFDLAQALERSVGAFAGGAAAIQDTTISYDDVGIDLD